MLFRIVAIALSLLLHGAIEPATAQSQRQSGSEHKALIEANALNFIRSNTMFGASFGGPIFERDRSAQLDARDIPVLRMRDQGGSAEQEQIERSPAGRTMTPAGQFVFNKNPAEYRSTGADNQRTSLDDLLGLAFVIALIGGIVVALHVKMSHFYLALGLGSRVVRMARDGLGSRLASGAGKTRILGRRIGQAIPMLIAALIILGAVTNFFGGMGSSSSDWDPPRTVRR